MLNIKSIAASLALMGSGSGLVACGGANPVVNATEVPGAQASVAGANCGATKDGGCGAKGGAQHGCGSNADASGPSSGCGAKADASCGAKTDGAGAASGCGAKPSSSAAVPSSESLANASPAASGQAATPPSKKGGKKGGKKHAGAQGGCGQGTCA